MNQGSTNNKESLKPTIVYFNPDFFTQVDDTVLRHLTKEFSVIWFYLYESFNKGSMRYGEEYVKEYGEKYGIETKVYYQKKKGRHPMNYLFFRQIAQDMNQHSPTIVYHCIRNPFWGIAIKTTLKCRNVVMGIHDAQAHSYTLSITSILNKLFRDVILRFHKNYITFSPNQHDLFKRNYGFDSAMVGMSCKDFGKSDKTVKPIREGINLLFFGSIHLYKGLDLLIRAMEELRTKYQVKNIKLTIAGRGPHWEECRQYINTPEMYDLRIRFIDNSEIPDLMCEATFLALPYRNATQSGPLVTAIAYELPIFAPNYGCFRETYNDSSAILYEPDQLTESLLKLSKIAQTEYDKLKEACKIVKKNNSEEAISANYCRCFKELIN